MLPRFFLQVTIFDAKRYVVYHGCFKEVVGNFFGLMVNNIGF